MDSSDGIQIIVLIALICLSAFFSSSETALTTVSRIRMRSLMEDGNKKAQNVLDVTENKSKMLAAILIGNNIVNLSASSLATILGVKFFGDYGAGIATGILTLVVLILGEIAPKNYATVKSDSLSLRIAGFFKVYILILTPIVFVINFIAGAFLFLFGVKKGDMPPQITEDELKTIVDVSHENGIIEHAEREMIQNVFDFGDAQAKEVMIPRVDVEFVNIDAGYEEVMEIFRVNKHTRMPVYEDNTDNVVGILNVKDLLLYDDIEHFSIRPVLREAYFTYELISLTSLFIDMQKDSINMAIVLDEYGATSGIVTLEDLIEEIVGDIRDEFDSDEEEDVVLLRDREYMVDGAMNLEDFGEEIGYSLSSEDYDSVGGYMLELLGHLPKVGDSVTTDQGVFMRVDEMSKHRVEKIFVRVPVVTENEE